MSLSLQILNEKNRILSTLREEVHDCVRCGICATRHQSVLADGNPMARVMLIGEAPGAEEDKQGKPFVGKAGQLLDRILSACGWTRKDVYIAHVLKCRPPNNRLPSDEEIANCIGYLHKQIEVVNPDYIICLGSVASKAIVGLPVSNARGKWFRHKHHKVLCTYHPAYLLRNEEAKKMVWDDLSLLLQEMK